MIRLNVILSEEDVRYTIEAADKVFEELEMFM